LAGSSSASLTPPTSRSSRSPRMPRLASMSNWSGSSPIGPKSRGASSQRLKLTVSTVFRATFTPRPSSAVGQKRKPTWKPVGRASQYRWQPI